MKFTGKFVYVYVCVCVCVCVYIYYIYISGPNLGILCIQQLDVASFCENYAKLYFDRKHLEKGLNRGCLLYVIYVTRLHLYFFCCSLDYITRLLIYTYSIVSGGCLIHFRLCCLHRVIIHPETVFP